MTFRQLKIAQMSPPAPVTFLRADVTAGRRCSDDTAAGSVLGRRAPWLSARDIAAAVAVEGPPGTSCAARRVPHTTACPVTPRRVPHTTAFPVTPRHVPSHHSVPRTPRRARHTTACPAHHGRSSCHRQPPAPCLRELRPLPSWDGCSAGM